MTKTYRGVLTLALVIPLLWPAAAAAATPAGVTKGLDYLHTRQRTDGGFAYSSTQGNTADTPWVMLAIAAGGNSPARWRVGGLSPVAFLQNTNLTTAAANSGNAPEYYALCILAYRAADRTDLLSSAGSTQIDLVAKLESYQSPTDGYYAPSTTGSTTAATETTAWAVLGLVAAYQSGSSVSDAVSWLEANPNTTTEDGAGGFGSSPGSQSSTTITSLVVQALVAAKVPATNAVVQDAAGFIETMQAGSKQAGTGGFMDSNAGYANTPSTAWAIEGLHAAGINPRNLVIGGHTPYTFLADRRQKNGSSHEFTGDLGDVMNATIQATIALTGKTLPIAHGPNVLTRFDPSFVAGSVTPKNGARFAGRTVEIKAAYHDNVNGTGIKVGAVKVTVDGKSKTKAAHISASHLSLQLTGLANGSHTFVIHIRDWAGNDVHTTHSFTVAVPTGGGSTGGGTHPGGGTGSGGGSGGGSVVHHSATPTPKATITPAQSESPGVTLTPTPSSSFPSTLTSPSPSASVVGQIAGSGGSGGGGNTAVVVGTTLAVLVPLGFAGSWLVRRRLLGVMDGATRGEVLPPGSSAWQRFWKSSGGAPPGGSGE